MCRILKKKSEKNRGTRKEKKEGTTAKQIEVRRDFV